MANATSTGNAELLRLTGAAMDALSIPIELATPGELSDRLEDAMREVARLWATGHRDELTAAVGDMTDRGLAPLFICAVATVAAFIVEGGPVLMQAAWGTP